MPGSGHGLTCQCENGITIRVAASQGGFGTRPYKNVAVAVPMVVLAVTVVPMVVLAAPATLLRTVVAVAL
ncbi:MAG TPA: hypothetical protein VLK32_03100 [Bacillota bacterium]|nr:hypothetical protein [Bacillota bacterium]